MKQTKPGIDFEKILDCGSKGIIGNGHADINWNIDNVFINRKRIKLTAIRDFGIIFFWTTLSSVGLVYICVDILGEAQPTKQFQ